MSTALYRRYRPESFADVIGQEHVTEPLMQALKSGRVNHAYLFSGPRGCGKTTSARILARCLNCEQGPTPTPCDTCDSCVALARGGSGSIDVIEIDAASHGGVDDARDLRERAAFGPAQARYKVYIIDEAHMVTPHGFNALLKVVEEPPEHVKFIFATTEPEKVLSTIRSRTHHYPFHLVPPARLTAYLEQVCESEGASVEAGVLSFVTRAGGGSVRDSLSVLDQLISGADEQGLTYERTASLLGFTDNELLDAVVLAVAARDAASVFTQIDKVMESGHDPRRFVEDLLERYRDLIVLLAVGDRGAGLLPGAPQDHVERMQHQAQSYGAASLTRCADVVSHGLAEMTGAVSYRLLLELICARLLLPGAAGEQGYGARLDRIERRLTVANEQPSASPASTQGSGSRGRPASAARPHPVEPQPVQPQPAQPQSVAPGTQTQVHEPEPVEPEPIEPEFREPEFSETASEPEAAQPQRAAPGAATHTRAENAPSTGAIDTDAIRRAWPEVLDKVRAIRKVTWSFVSVNTKIVDFDGRRLLLQIDTAGQAETFRRGSHGEVVRQALIEAIGVDTKVESTVANGEAPGANEPRRGRTRTPDPAPRGNAVAGPPASNPRPEGSPRGGAGQARSSRTAEAASRGSSESPRGRDENAAWGQGSTSQALSWAQGSGQAQVATEQLPQPATPAPIAPTRPGGDIPAQDDDDLENSTTVGQSVIESVLGGTVIAIDDPYQR